MRRNLFFASVVLNIILINAVFFRGDTLGSTAGEEAGGVKDEERLGSVLAVQSEPPCDGSRDEAWNPFLKYVLMVQRLSKDKDVKPVFPLVDKWMQYFEAYDR